MKFNALTYLFFQKLLSSFFLFFLALTGGLLFIQITIKWSHLNWSDPPFLLFFLLYQTSLLIKITLPTSLFYSIYQTTLTWTQKNHWISLSTLGLASTPFRKILMHFLLLTCLFSALNLGFAFPFSKKKWNQLKKQSSTHLIEECFFHQSQSQQMNQHLFPYRELDLFFWFEKKDHQEKIIENLFLASEKQGQKHVWNALNAEKLTVQNHGLQIHKGQGLWVNQNQDQSFHLTFHQFNLDTPSLLQNFFLFPQDPQPPISSPFHWQSHQHLHQNFYFWEDLTFLFLSFFLGFLAFFFGLKKKEHLWLKFSPLFFFVVLLIMKGFLKSKPHYSPYLLMSEALLFLILVSLLPLKKRLKI